MYLCRLSKALDNQVHGKPKHEPLESKQTHPATILDTDVPKHSKTSNTQITSQVKKMKESGASSSRNHQ